MTDREAPRMQIIPPGTTIFEPNGIHEVTLQFPDENSAIIFYEWLKELAR